MLWKIAIGVFIGLSLFAISTCGLLLLSTAAVMDAPKDTQQQALAQFKKDISNPDPMGLQAAAQRQKIEEQRRRVAEARQQYQAREAARIHTDERCIGGQKFRRVKNGWEQIGACKNL